MEEFVLEAEQRKDLGSRAAALLRGEGKLPLNIYGHKEDNSNLQVNYREFEKFFAVDLGQVMQTVNGLQLEKVSW